MLYGLVLYLRLQLEGKNDYKNKKIKKDFLKIKWPPPK